MPNNEKIKLEICLGTTCFVMGASKLQDIETRMPEEWKDKVEIVGCTCLDICQNSGFMKAPFVKINGEIMDSATIEKILEKLEELIG